MLTAVSGENYPNLFYFLFFFGEKYTNRNERKVALWTRHTYEYESQLHFDYLRKNIYFKLLGASESLRTCVYIHVDMAVYNRHINVFSLLQSLSFIQPTRLISLRRILLKCVHPSIQNAKFNMHCCKTFNVNGNVELFSSLLICIQILCSETIEF